MERQLHAGGEFLHPQIRPEPFLDEVEYRLEPPVALDVRKYDFFQAGKGFSQPRIELRLQQKQALGIERAPGFP